MSSRGKWVIFATLGLWALFSLLVIGCETDDDMSVVDDFLIRLCALVSFCVCLLVGRRCDRKGLLPDIKDED